MAGFTLEHLLSVWHLGERVAMLGQAAWQDACAERQPPTGSGLNREPGSLRVAPALVLWAAAADLEHKVKALPA